MNGSLLLLLGAFMVAFFVFSKRGAVWGTGANSVYCRGRFMSANEKCFLGALDHALGGNYRVFTQVRLAELVDVEARIGGPRRQAALNRVFCKSVDFVVCSATSLDPILVIEVDDRTHLLAWRKERDVFINAVFAEIGLPLVRVPASRAYSVLGLRKTLTEAGLGGGREVAAFGRTANERGGGYVER
jgi:hypothetical protein